MNFCTYEFALFFAVAFGAFLLLRKSGAWSKSKLVLLLGSFLSYSFWYYPYLAILVTSTVVDYVCGRSIHSTSNPRRRKLLLAVSIIANLSILGFFKYYDFFAENVGNLLSAVGMGVTPRTLNLVLPIGISFYTFQSMSYTIDVYRGRCKPVTSFADFALYVSFFTQLVAGPIVRARDFLPQLARVRRFRWPQFYWGAYLIILGCFKKMVLADNIAPSVDFFFSLSDHSQFHALTCWMYMFAYGAQIYADFSGYTDIAIGLAHTMGFRLPRNFYYPYIALGFGDFWRRWHISLSTWFRDYLYLPLGGSRGSSVGTLRNLVIVMFLAGLWHGANWLFVIWGLLHGAYLLVDHLVLRHVIRALGDRGPMAKAGRLAIRGGTFACVIYAWVFFRSRSLGQALEISKSMFCNFWGTGIGHEVNLGWGQFWGIVYMAHLIVLFAKGDKLHKRFGKWLYFITAVIMILLLLFNRRVTGNAFIYFQF